MRVICRGRMTCRMYAGQMDACGIMWYTLLSMRGNKSVVKYYANKKHTAQSSRLRMLGSRMLSPICAIRVQSSGARVYAARMYAIVSSGVSGAGDSSVGVLVTASAPSVSDTASSTSWLCTAVADSDESDDGRGMNGRLRPFVGVGASAPVESVSSSAGFSENGDGGCSAGLGSAWSWTFFPAKASARTCDGMLLLIGKGGKYGL